MNVIRVIALSVLLAAGGALAQGKKKQTPPPLPQSPLTKADKPKSCADQCKVLEKVMVDPCKKGAGSNKQAQQMCTTNARKMVDACYGSCKNKGRVDKQYIMERIKPPAGYKGGQGAKEGGHDAAQEDEGDAH